MQRLAPFLSAASALALSACAAGPDYVAPARPASAGGSFVAAGSAVTPAAPHADWWRLYDDPVLDGLIAQALAANTDIREAVARIERSRAVLRGARADRLPNAEASAGADYGRMTQAQRAPGGAREDWQVDLGLNVQYEADLFGRIGRNVEAARGDVAAAEADADAVRVIVAAETARAYADAVSSRVARPTPRRRCVRSSDWSSSVTIRSATASRSALDTASA